MEGNQQPPPGGNTSNATPGLVGVSFLLATALFAYGVRIYTRIRPIFKLAATDYITSCAGCADVYDSFCELVTLVILLTAIHLGVSGYDYYISPTTRIKLLKLLFALGLPSFWASSLTRISIGSMLLRLPISNIWRVTLWILVVIQIAMPIGANVFQLLQCRPIHAWWEQVPGSVCWTARTSQNYGYIYAAIGTASDLVFAIMPVHLFWSLHRPVMERILVSVLMGFGIIAAVAGVMKIYHISAWNPREVTFRDWVPLLWWYRVEEIGLIVAACAPFLKPLIERVLHRFGASRFRFVTIRLNTIRSDEENTARDSEKTDYSMQRISEVEQSAQQDRGQTASIVSSDIHSNNEVKYQKEQDYVEV
ncbi:hypothetical protein K469DRAFT_669398 [Zopfia rhizophila CBS 207.26]|uniref:Rhodopsin domain-containing protein n=1 Tax=Zopfia rhizophila CBS 207.26 TaxID=1314779 RepID=A0A6A6DX13_9PEZI|nr:hypothetical protein K469DRAFT_669398 [Zopfia rhizophila CBS 207.26]